MGQNIALPGFPGAMAFNASTSELWVASSARTDAGTNLASISIIDTTTFAVKATLSLNAQSAGFEGIVFAPDQGKAFVSSNTTPDGGFGSEIDAVDLTTHAFTTVTTYQSAIDGPLGMTYDANLHRVYVSVDDAHYLYVIDATTSTLVTTVPGALVADAGIGGGFGNIVVDPTGSLLYMATADQNQYPMVATLPLDGGAPYDVLGGQAAGWSLGAGLALVVSDAGATGATAIQLSDGGSFVQLIDPASFNLHPGDTPAGIFVPGKGFKPDGMVCIAVLDSCGKRRIRIYNGATGAEIQNAVFPDAYANVQIDDLVSIDPATPTGGPIQVIVNLQPRSSSSGGGTPLDQITVVDINPVAGSSPPCP